MRLSDILGRGSQRVAVAVLASAIAFGSAYGQSKSVSVMTYGGVFTETQKEAFFDPFTKETGIGVTSVTPNSLAKIKASVTMRTYEADLSSIADYDYYQALVAGLLEPIDYTLVQKRAGAPKELYSEYGVSATTVSYQIVYNPKKFPNGGPQTWADFWDVKKFPGTRSLFDSPVANIEFALLAAGVPKDKIYPLTDAKIQQALAKLDQIKPHIRVWWTNGSQSQQIFKDGEIDVMMMWNGRATDLQKQGVPIVQVWNEAVFQGNTWIVLKGSPQKESAMRFINSSIDPAREAVFARKLHYGSLNPAILTHLNPEEIAVQPTSPEHQQAGLRLDAKWWGENMAKTMPIWQSWLIK